MPPQAHDHQWADDANEVRGPAPVATGKSKKITVQVDDQTHNGSDYSTEREIVVLDDKDPNVASNNNSDRDRHEPTKGKKKNNW